MSEGDFDMTEWEKAQNGYLYDANYDRKIVESRTRCADLCYKFNCCRPSDTKKQKQLLEQIFGNIKRNSVITAPFYCDYGFDFSTAGHAIDSKQRSQGLEIALPITVGDNVWIGTNVSVLRE